MAVVHGPLRGAVFELLGSFVSGFRVGQADAVADAVHMGIDRNDVLPKGEAQHDIGAFAAYSG